MAAGRALLCAAASLVLLLPIALGQTSYSDVTFTGAAVGGGGVSWVDANNMTGPADDFVASVVLSGGGTQTSEAVTLTTTFSPVVPDDAVITTLQANILGKADNTNCQVVFSLSPAVWNTGGFLSSTGLGFTNVSASDLTGVIGLDVKAGLVLSLTKSGAGVTCDVDTVFFDFTWEPAGAKTTGVAYNAPAITATTATTATAATGTATTITLVTSAATTVATVKTFTTATATTAPTEISSIASAAITATTTIATALSTTTTTASTSAIVTQGASSVSLLPSTSTPDNQVADASPTVSENAPPVGTIVGGIVGALVCAMVVAAGFLFKNRQHTGSTPTAMEESREIELPKLPRLDGAKQLHGVIVKEQLGEGNFGAVFLGSWKGQAVALKQVTSGDAVELAAELRVLEQLNHPCVVRCFGVTEISRTRGGGAAIVLEFCENGSLDVFLKKNSNSAEKLLTMSVQVARGLEYLADQGVLHRDLAARNVLLDAAGNCKLTDFGLARAVGADGVYQVHSAVPVRWTANEVLLGEPASASSDVYSLGITIWEIFSQGSVPFGDIQSHNAIIHAVASGVRPSIPTRMPEAVFDVVQRCWSMNQNERPEAGAAAEELDALRLGSMPSSKVKNGRTSVLSSSSNPYMSNDADYGTIVTV